MEQFNKEVLMKEVEDNRNMFSLAYVDKEAVVI